MEYMNRKSPRKSRKRQYSSKKKPPNLKRFVVFVLLGFLTIFIYAFFSGNKSVLKLYSLHQQKNELITEKERLITENEDLQKEIKKLQTDKRYIEEVARKKYNFKKKNEDVIIVKSE